jgi:hypothetical protein
MGQVSSVRWNVVCGRWQGVGCWMGCQEVAEFAGPIHIDSPVFFLFSFFIFSSFRISYSQNYIRHE